MAGISMKVFVHYLGRSVVLRKKKVAMRAVMFSDGTTEVSRAHSRFNRLELKERIRV